MTNITELKTLKDYIKDFQERRNESTALNHLIIISTDDNDLTNVTFRDKSINFIYHNIINKYKNITGQDNIQNWFINGLYERVFEKADLSYDPQQIVKWASVELDGYIKRRINTEIEDIGQVMSESFIAEDGTEQSHYDSIAYDEYFNILNSDYKFEKYLESLGGLKSLLSARQHEIYDLSNIEGSTHQSIADELGISKQAVTKAINTAKNKVKKEFLSFKMFQQLQKNSDAYDQINEYLTNYANIASFDVADSFDYFNYTVNFLKDNAVLVNNAELLSNTRDINLDVVDVLMNNVHGSSKDLFISVLNSKVYSDVDNVIFAKRQHDQFVMGTIRAFNNYVENVNESIKVFSDNVVRFACDDNGYGEVAKVFV